MSDFLHSVYVLGTIDFGTGVVASILAILWAYQTRSDFDRDDALELIKIFMGGKNEQSAKRSCGLKFYISSLDYSALLRLEHSLLSSSTRREPESSINYQYLRSEPRRNLYTSFSCAFDKHIENNRADYQRVSQVMTKARDDGRCSFKWIVDRSRPEYSSNVFEDPTQYEDFLDK